MNDNISISTSQLFEQFPNAEAARIYLEKNRWNGHVVCPHCDTDDRITARKGKRIGYYACGHCKEEFTVRTGTIFERSHVPLNKWIYAMYLTVTARKGISSLQLSKQIGVTQKTAWFMQVRLREACDTDGDDSGMLDGIVEADESFVSGKRSNMSNAKRKELVEAGAGRGTDGKVAVLGMRERDGCTVAMPVENVDGRTLKGKIARHVAKGSSVYTDEAKAYNGLPYHHKTVNHSAMEYVGANDIHTNSIESVWAVLKRGLYGVWHHASRKHLHRYLNEATFRLNDGNCEVQTNERIDAMIAGSFGKRITYVDATE